MKNFDIKNLIIFVSGAISSLVVAWLYGADFRLPEDKNADPSSGSNSQQEAAQQQNKNSDLREIAQVQQVVDGDTVTLATGEKVRLLGIDTPEIGEYFYEEATQKLKELIGQKEVYLEKDISETDRYDRLLRHIYVDDTWVNEIMIEEGYAKFITYPPDVRHVQRFKELQSQARANNRGMWQNKE